MKPHHLEDKVLLDGLENDTNGNKGAAGSKGFARSKKREAQKEGNNKDLIMWSMVSYDPCSMQ